MWALEYRVWILLSRGRGEGVVLGCRIGRKMACLFLPWAVLFWKSWVEGSGDECVYGFASAWGVDFLEGVEFLGSAFRGNFNYGSYENAVAFTAFRAAEGDGVVCGVYGL